MKMWHTNHEYTLMMEKHCIFCTLWSNIPPPQPWKISLLTLGSTHCSNFFLVWSSTLVYTLSTIFLVFLGRWSFWFSLLTIALYFATSLFSSTGWLEIITRQSWSFLLLFTTVSFAIASLLGFLVITPATWVSCKKSDNLKLKTFCVWVDNFCPNWEVIIHRQINKKGKF